MLRHHRVSDAGLPVAGDSLLDFGRVAGAGCLRFVKGEHSPWRRRVQHNPKSCALNNEGKI